MPSPVDAGRVVTSVVTGVRPWILSLPPGIVAGDLLIAVGRGGGTITTLLPPGWSWLVQNDGSDASDDTVSIIYKWADGTEGTTLSWDMGFAIKGAGIAWRITGAANPSTQAPLVASALFTTVANTANPAAITPAGGSKDFLFLAIATKDGIGATSAAPAGFGNLVSGGSSGGTAATNATVAAATKQSTEATEDPGVFTHAAATTGGVVYTIAVYPGVAAPLPKMETLIDDFTTIVDKAVKWPSADAAVVWDSGNGGQCKIPCTSSYWQLATAALSPGYDLTGSYIMVKPTIPAVGNGGREVYLDLQTNASKAERIFLAYSGGNLLARKYVGGTNTGQNSAAYDPVAHAYWRIRESGGTTYWETSPDAVTWTVLYSVANPFTLTALYVSLNSGYFGSEVAANTFFDKVNTLPVAVATDSNGATTESATVSVPSSTPISDIDANGATTETAIVVISALTTTDSGTAADSTTLNAVLSVTDANGAMTEATSLVAQPATTDVSGATTESASLLASLAAAADVNGASTEVAATSAVRVADSDVSGATVETQALSAGGQVSSSDSGTAAESLLLVASGLASADAGIGADLASPKVVTVVLDADALVIEVSALVSVQTAADTGSGADTASTTSAQQVSGTDAGVGSEIVVLLAKPAPNDFGTGADTAAVVITHVFVSGSDAGTGTDTANITEVTYIVTDDGTGIDTARVFSGNDLGTFTGGKIILTVPGVRNQMVTGNIDRPEQGPGLTDQAIRGNLVTVPAGYIKEGVA